MTQEIIAYLIVLLTICYVVWRLVKLMTGKKGAKNVGCMNCPSASSCGLKDLKNKMERQNQGCEYPDI